MAKGTFQKYHQHNGIVGPISAKLELHGNTGGNAHHEINPKKRPKTWSYHAKFAFPS